MTEVQSYIDRYYSYNNFQEKRLCNFYVTFDGPSTVSGPQVTLNASLDDRASLDLQVKRTVR